MSVKKNLSYLRYISEWVEAVSVSASFFFHGIEVLKVLVVLISTQVQKDFIRPHQFHS